MKNQLTIGAVDALVAHQEWQPPRLADFAQATVQAYDQSLTHTGVAIVRSTGTALVLISTAMIRPPEEVTSLKAFEGNCARADYLGLHAKRHRQGYASRADAVVYERPPTQGRRLDSIIMAGREIHRATDGQAVLVDNRHAKKLLLGRAGTKTNPVTKAHVKEAVERYLAPPSETGKNMPWNEHTRDACMLALAWLLDEKRRRNSDLRESAA